MTDQPNDTAAIEIWARMLNAADIHVHGPEHQTWQRLTPKLQEQYREAARWLIPRLTVQPQRATGKHRPPCIDGDHCGEAAHCPPPAAGIRDAARQASGQQPECAPCNDTGACNGGPCAHPAAGLSDTQPANDRAAVRCTSCDHEAQHHDADGRCWFTVEQGVPGRDCVCSCQRRRMADEETSR